jgi:hypothetical protein
MDITTSASTDSGIYLHWDRISPGYSGYSGYSGYFSTPNLRYEILRSSYFDGLYTSIDTVDWPADQYVDTTGDPSYYYKIQEYDITDLNNPIAGVTSQPMAGEEVLIMQSLIFQLGEMLNVPIYDEECIFNLGRTIGRWAFSNWNYWPRPEVRITGSTDDGNNDPYIILDENVPILRTAGSVDNYADGLKYKLDYKGKGYFIDENNLPTAIQNYDAVYASYNVKLFTATEMNDALYMSLQTLNGQPGTNKYYTLGSTPLYYDPALVTGAVYYLLRGLLNRLTQREIRMLVQDEGSGSGIFESVNAIRENAKMYKEEWDLFLKSIPKAKYPSIYIITTPQMMLPGGRSRMFRQAFKGLG